MKWQRFMSIPIIAVFGLMGFVYYMTVFVFIQDWVGLQSSAGCLNTLLFTLLASLCLFSFFVCVLTDPGFVPSSYIPDVEGISNVSDHHQLDNQYGAQERHCDKCSTYKPPRAHHCKVCRRCIMRMDHHCIWINNCVGYWNYKAFFALVLYTTIGSMYSTVMIVSCALQNDLDFTGRLPVQIFYVTFGIIMVGLCFTLGTLLGWHIYLITRNMTTIEYYEGICAAWLARKSGQSYRHPFDVTFYKNITSVLGSNMLKWLCPTAVSHLKDGSHFPTSHDS
ncbi:zf-DHHC domain-containing protein [Cephalotus follicularis]|uniref:S-acyltransferase n=1 Tax=Cephalotus follicularis TaxID=3775 RepID=A0A1Q3B3E4_CEPFO|nr:zf-DHHC domain-containing protein [Cephalotus follicularis]